MGEPMTGKQWLLITLVVIVNIILFGTLLGPPSSGQQAVVPAASWTPCPTFTASPFPTATAILMPTTPPLPTSVVHAVSSEGYVVQEGDTLEGIAERYGIGVHTLRMLNRLTEGDAIEVGQELLVPAAP